MTTPFIAILQIANYCEEYMYIDYNRNRMADGRSLLFKKQLGHTLTKFNKMKLKHYMIGLLMLFFCQCNKEGNLDIACILLIDEAIFTMETCRTNLLPEATEIAENLVGTWKLVGYGCGFCGPFITPPTAIIQLTENKGRLIFKDEFDGEMVLDFDWRLDEIVNSLEEKATYRFKTEPRHHALNMDIFCSEFMFFDERPFDGQLMLYQKL